MVESIEKPVSLPTRESAATLVATTARWLGFADDLPLGCECADPALQIERWEEETLGRPPSAS